MGYFLGCVLLMLCAGGAGVSWNTTVRAKIRQRQVVNGWPSDAKIWQSAGHVMGKEGLNGGGCCVVVLRRCNVGELLMCVTADGEFGQVRVVEMWIGVFGGCGCFLDCFTRYGSLARGFRLIGDYEDYQEAAGLVDVGVTFVGIADWSFDWLGLFSL